MADGRVILLSKQDRFSREAADFARGLLGERLLVFTGQVGDPYPDLSGLGPADTLVSFLSPWIVRQEDLERVAVAINFHPASVDYPGIGCYNFALYDGAAEFGAVCHHMLAKVDTGLIVDERRFPLLPEDSVETLKLRTMETMVAMFRDLIALIARGEPLPLAGVHWTRRPYTRKQLHALKVITPDMDEAEVERRVRAVTYPGYPGAVLHRPDGTLHHYPVPDREPLA
ncbi:MAG TPA: formyltransferase family protein [Allosphingosinicella sp.]|nr:formyltransferase family protein [Allosphingosinicella sp.]